MLLELMLIVYLLVGGAAFLESMQKKVQTRTELSLLKLCRVHPFFERQCKRYGNFLILNFTLQSYVKRI